MMDADSQLHYQIEHNPDPDEIGRIGLQISFTTQVVNINPRLTRRFFRSMPIKEFIEDDSSPHKEQLFFFLKESGVNEADAITLILRSIQLASDVTSLDGYCPHYALSMWLTFDLVPLNQEPLEYDLEEALQTSFDDYATNIKPASKVGVEALSRKTYEKKRKASLIAGNKTEKKTRIISNKRIKRETSPILDQCIICLDEFKTGREIVTLPCGHEFDDKCIVEWFKVSHVCPLCRFELPCQDDEILRQIQFSN